MTTILPQPQIAGAPQVHRNAVTLADPPVISVLIPYLRDDPRILMEAVGAQAARLGAGIEIVTLDDGTGDERLRADVIAAVDGLPVPATSIVMAANSGRSAARNLLARHATADHLLYADADTVPDSPDFLQRYLDLARQGTRAVVIGGFSLDQASRDGRFALHRYIAAKMDCLPAATRNLAPLQYGYGSNFMVPRAEMLEIGYDERFRGWGWEDQEWTIRMSALLPVFHIDNTVSHLGLDEIDTLLAKYASSGDNFKLIRARHPAVVDRFAAARAARIVNRLPGRGVLKRLTGAVARSGLAPMEVRTFALRGFRALHYAD